VTERIVAMLIIGIVFYFRISAIMRVLYGKAMVTRLWQFLAPGVILSTQLTGLAAKLGEIAAASDEQAQGLEQVNSAVSEMNQVTQQNTAI
jgi:hypothetical protein